MSPLNRWHSAFWLASILMILPWADNGGTASIWPAIGTSTAMAQQQPATSQAVPGPDGASKALAQCDTLASQPDDPGRELAGVPDNQLAPGPAIRACQEAVALNPDNPRALFQLGRAYWIVRRDKEAFTAFLGAAKLDYPAAMKYIGDAYLQGRGLPSQERQDAYTALEWYKRSCGNICSSSSSVAGFSDAEKAVTEVEAFLKTHKFDPSIFANPRFIAAIYDNRINQIPTNEEYFFKSYVAGFVQTIGSNEMFFMNDSDCTPLVDIATQFGPMGEVYSQMFNDMITGMFVDVIAGVVTHTDTKIEPFKPVDQPIAYMNQGYLDAVTMKNRYSCNSDIARQIMGNLKAGYGNRDRVISQPMEGLFKGTPFDLSQPKAAESTPSASQKPQSVASAKPLPATPSPSPRLNLPQDRGIPWTDPRALAAITDGEQAVKAGNCELAHAQLRILRDLWGQDFLAVTRTTAAKQNKPLNDAAQLFYATEMCDGKKWTPDRSTAKISAQTTTPKPPPAAQTPAPGQSMTPDNPGVADPRVLALLNEGQQAFQARDCILAAAKLRAISDLWDNGRSGNPENDSPSQRKVRDAVAALALRTDMCRAAMAPSQNPYTEQETAYRVNQRLAAGRLFEAEGVPVQAALSYDAAYRANPRGPRAQEGLLGYAKALVQTDQREASCKALNQMRSEFPNPRSDLVAQITLVRQQSNCGP